ncbi:MAG: hypothetical protein MUC45_06080 [Actinomycetia bacterium]|jgi:hypothetical protein|nr:hypothetical protein [Actinomycetes bacterium]
MSLQLQTPPTPAAERAESDWSLLRGVALGLVIELGLCAVVAVLVTLLFLGVAA